MSVCHYTIRQSFKEKHTNFDILVKTHKISKKKKLVFLNG